MNRPSADLLREVFPDVKLTRDIGTYETLLAIDRAGELLGFTPALVARRGRRRLRPPRGAGTPHPPLQAAKILGLLILATVRCNQSKHR